MDCVRAGAQVEESRAPAGRCLFVDYTKLPADGSQQQRKTGSYDPECRGGSLFALGELLTRAIHQQRLGEIFASLDASPRLNVRGGYRPLQRSVASPPEGSPSMFTTRGGALRFSLAKVSHAAMSTHGGWIVQVGDACTVLRARELNRQLFVEELECFVPAGSAGIG